MSDRVADWILKFVFKRETSRCESRKKSNWNEYQRVENKWKTM